MTASTYYDALGLAPTATDDQLAQAHGEHTTAAAQRAWAVLGDPELRAAYDAQLQTGGQRRWSVYVPSFIGAVLVLSILDFAIAWHTTHPAPVSQVVSSSRVAGSSLPGYPPGYHMRSTTATGTGLLSTLTAPIHSAQTAIKGAQATVSHAASVALTWLLAVVAWFVGVLPLSAASSFLWRRWLGGQPRAARAGLVACLGLVALLPLWMGPVALWLALVPVVALVAFVAVRAHPEVMRAAGDRVAPVVRREVQR